MTSISRQPSNNALLISNTPAGGIEATNVQAAINELDVEKVRKDDLASKSDITKGAEIVGHEGASVSQVLRSGKKDQHLASSIKRFYKTISDIASGTVAQSCFFALGDSIMDYPTRGIYNRLSAAIDVCGVALDPIFGNATGITAANTGDVIQTDGTNFTYWPTGIHLDVGPLGTVKYQVGGATFVGTEFKVYYAKKPGVGTMTIELLDGASAVVATQVVDTNAALSAGIAIFTVAAAPRQIRVTGNTGRCILLGASAINRSVGGLVLAAVGRGGLGTDQINSAPAQIWKAVIADLAPSLATYSMRESAAFIPLYLAPLLTNFAAASTNTDWILFGVNPYGGAAGVADYGLATLQQPSWLENEAIRSVAKQFNYGFFDTYATLPDPSKLEDPTNVHLSITERNFLTSHFINQIGLDFVLTIASQFPQIFAALASVQSLTVSQSNARNNTQKALKFSSNGDFDGYIDFYRGIAIRDQAGNVIAAGSSLGNGQGWVQQAYASPGNSFNVPSGFYADGHWTKVWNNGGLETRLRTSNASVRRRYDPMYALAASNGGSPLQCFLTTDPAFTTAADYAGNEVRIAYDAVGGRLVFQIQPAGGGAIKTANVVLV